MQFSKQQNYYFIRLDKGEEIVSALETFCEEENIKLGMIQGIGAVNEAIVGIYNPTSNKYVSKK